MIRTVWLAIICVVLVSALAAGKALRNPADPSVAALPSDETTVGIAYGQDTLSKADRLEINYVRLESPSQPVLPSIEPAAPVVAPPKPPAETKIISRHWRDPNAISSSLKNAKPAKPAEPNKTSRNAESKRNQAADRSRSAAPAKPCHRLGPIGDLLKSVNLSPGCTS
jgi:hypothetical protein